jgi:hypothetical protein
VAVRDELIFKLKGERQGIPISPETWDVAELTRFLQEVEILLRPEVASATDRAYNPITISYEEGSAQLRTRSSRARRERTLDLVSRASRLQATPMREVVATAYDLAYLQPKQQKVIRSWFRQAQAFGDVYQILDPSTNDKVLLNIDRYTTLIEVDEEVWVPTEQYLQGRILSLGGINKTGLIIEVGQHRYPVEATQEMLEKQEVNRVYHEGILRVRAERQLLSGELRNIALLHFVDYAPKFDQKEHAQTTKQVSAAFADIENLAAWVAQLRGD